MTAQRIVIAMHDFARGGTERIAMGLAAAWVEAGRDVTILCGTQEGEQRSRLDPRVQVVAVGIPRSSFSRLTLPRAMGDRIGALSPDAIFLPGNFHFFLARALRKACPGAAMVMKVSNPLLPRGAARWLARPVFRHFACAIDGFAALSTALARETEMAVPEKPVRVLHDPVFAGAVSEDAPAARGDGLQILWAGRLEPQKDVGLALRTLQALKVPAHLTLLGDGGLRDWTDQQIAALGLQDRASRKGHVPSIDPFLAKADILLMTSHYEGQPAVVGEALARGVPVVSTDCCAILHDMIAVPEAGRIVAGRDPAALAAALQAVSAAPRAPDVLRGLMRGFEPKHCAKAYLDWFDEMARARVS